MKRRRINGEVQRKVNSKLRILLPLIVVCATNYHVNGLVPYLFPAPKFGEVRRLVKPKISFWNQLLTKNRSGSTSGKSSSSLQMVLTTPDTIIEQASTQKLLDDLIDESVRTASRKPIMMQFDPTGSSIWRRWRGTIFSETWTSCIKNMAVAVILLFLTRLIPQMNENLKGFQILWSQLLSVTTFTLTFFLNQSYALWRKCYSLSRIIQGRLNDVGLFLASHATRKTPSSPSEPSTHTAASRQLLELISRYVRVFNILCYASFTRSHRPVLTPRGMRRLVERGLLTPAEREALVNAEVPATQRHNALLMWIVRCFYEGRKAGHIEGGAGMEQVFLDKIHAIRACYGGIGDELQGRMPLAYAHIVQILVDIIIWMYPFMAFSSDMAPFLGILGTGLLTLTYQGLFDLAKQFLDPYDNETYGKGDDPICVDTLVAESNSGSIRWLNGFAEMPFSAQRIKDGELFDYQLPVRGYSVEELAQMEKEKAQREKEQQEERDRKEAEQAKRIEEDRLKKLNEIINTTTISETNKYFANLTSNAMNVTLDEPQPPSSSTAFSSDSKNDETEIVIQEELIDIAVETLADDKSEKASKGHRVTSLGDGRPIAYNKKESVTQGIPDVIEEDSTSIRNEKMNNVEKRMTDLLGETRTPDNPISKSADQQTDDEVPKAIGVTDMMLQPDRNFFDNVVWFDEVGADGQEYRLSQSMADEEWEEEIQFREEQKRNQPPMSDEEYREKVVDMIEAAADELKETRDILSASSDSELEATPRRKRQSLKYDQTKLDGISQLWGLPPSALSELRSYEEPKEVTVEENSFDTIMQLMGAAPIPKSQEEGTLISSNFNAISELWDVNVNAAGIGESTQILPPNNDVDSDGQEYRLSQMLADEDWTDSKPPAVEAPLTLEDYSRKVNEAYENVEKELKETEAILNAPPGADSYGLDQEESDAADEEEEEEVLSEKKSEKAVDASSEIRAEVQAAYEAVKKEEEMVEQQLEMRSKNDDPLALLFDDAEMKYEISEDEISNDSDKGNTGALSDDFDDSTLDDNEDHTSIDSEEEKGASDK